MPFNFLRKKPAAVEPEAAAGRPGARGHRVRPQDRWDVAFDGLTEEWRLMGVMHVDGRLSDALNRREAIAIADVSWAPADGTRPVHAGAGSQERGPVRPHRRAGRGGDPAAAVGGREGRPQDPQGAVRLRPRGAAVPDRRDRLHVRRHGTGAAPRPGDGDVRAGGRRALLPRRGAARRTKSTSCSSTGSTCAASSRSTSRPVSRRRPNPAPDARDQDLRGLTPAECPDGRSTPRPRPTGGRARVRRGRLPSSG